MDPGVASICITNISGNPKPVLIVVLSLSVRKDITDVGIVSEPRSVSRCHSDFLSGQLYRGKAIRKMKQG